MTLRTCYNCTYPDYFGFVSVPQYIRLIEITSDGRMNWNVIDNNMNWNMVMMKFLKQERMKLMIR